jgi:hypothetical protein
MTENEPIWKRQRDALQAETLERAMQAAAQESPAAVPPDTGWYVPHKGNPHPLQIGIRGTFVTGEVFCWQSAYTGVLRIDPTIAPAPATGWEYCVNVAPWQPLTAETAFAVMEDDVIRLRCLGPGSVARLLLECHDSPAPPATVPAPAPALSDADCALGGPAFSIAERAAIRRLLAPQLQAWREEVRRDLATVQLCRAERPYDVADGYFEGRVVSLQGVLTRLDTLLGDKPQ